MTMTTLTKATVFEHDHLKVRFTCTCGTEHCANFTRKEHFDCKQCGRRHYPAIRLVTHEPAGQRA